MATDISPPASPCGMCRQFIREFCEVCVHDTYDERREQVHQHCATDMETLQALDTHSHVRQGQPFGRHDTGAAAAHVLWARSATTVERRGISHVACVVGKCPANGRGIHVVRYCTVSRVWQDGTMAAATYMYLSCTQSHSPRYTHTYFTERYMYSTCKVCMHQLILMQPCSLVVTSCRHASRHT